MEQIFGLVDSTTANGRTVLAAGLTLGLLVLPIIIINAQEAIRAVPQSLRKASYGLGATKWQTVWSHVLPNALPGILTGTILAISRAIGETAPLVVVGASTAISFDPASPFSKFTTLPIQIYQWTSRPQDEFRSLAAAAILVLLIILLSLNASAIFLRNRFSRRLLIMAQPLLNQEKAKYVLETKDLGIFYGDFRAVTSVNIPIQRHMITAIIGPSGCGKSTLLRAFNRMNELFTGTSIEGEVLFEGENLYDPCCGPGRSPLPNRDGLPEAESVPEIHL